MKKRAKLSKRFLVKSAFIPYLIAASLIVISGSLLILANSLSRSINMMAALLLLCLVFANPFWGLCLVSFFIALGNALLVISPQFGFIKLLSIFVLLVYLLRLISHRGEIFYSKKFTIAISLILWLIFSLLWATYIPPYLTSQIVTFLMLFGLFFLVPQLVQDEKKLEFLLFSYTLGALAASALAFKNFLSGHFYYGYTGPGSTPRVAAFMGEDPTYYAYSLVPAFYFILFKTLSLRGTFKKILAVVFCIYLLSCSSLSGARAFFISAGGTFVLLIIIMRLYLKEKFQVVSPLLAGAITLGVAFYFLILPKLPAELSNRLFSKEIISRGLEGRLDIYKIGIVEFLEHPILGVGMGNSTLLSQTTRDIALYKYNIFIKDTGSPVEYEGIYYPLRVRDPHNSFIQILAEGGMPAFGLFVWLLALLILSQLRSIHKVPRGSAMWFMGLALLASLLHLILHDLARGTINSQPLWLLFGLFVAYERISNGEEKKIKGANELQVSVIIPTKDRKEDLLETIKSLGRQTYIPEELVIVDASEESSENEAKKLWNSGKLLYLSTSFPCLPCQRNIGIKVSSGDIIVFLDDDVILHPCFIERIISPLKETTAVAIGAVAGRVIPFGGLEYSNSSKYKFNLLIEKVFLLGGGKDGEILPSGFANNRYYLSSEGKFVKFLPGGACAIRREVFHLCSYDEKLRGVAIMEDIDISMQIVNAGYKIYYEPNAIVWHKASPKKGFNLKNNWHMRVVNHYYFYRKHLQNRMKCKIAFWWANLGLLIKALQFFCVGIARQNKNYKDLIIGYIKGLRDIYNYRIPFNP